ncbi:hypothetical protein NKJ23_15205 [Mesorhizobium sp. M0184]
MNFVIEFYRSRDADEATLDRVSLEAPNLRAGQAHIRLQVELRLSFAFL